MIGQPEPYGLEKPGRNVQGVPMGLVNWMTLNRRKTEPQRAVQWSALALTRPGEFRNRGFVDFGSWRSSQ